MKTSDVSITLLAGIHPWLAPGGYLLIAPEAADVPRTADGLEVPMSFSSFPPEKVVAQVEEAGFQIMESATEDQIEVGTEIPYLWLLVRKEI